MTYPGNESLSQDIRNRILETFRQTVELAGRGNRKEAALGCDFILRLDPLFDPARQLQKRLGSDESLEIDDLRARWQELLGGADDGAGVTEEEAGADAQAAERELDNALASLEGPAPAAEEQAEISGSPTGEMSGQPGVALDSESERRIRDLLDEGQEAFERLEYQAAIDAWSRIFLIDIDHPEANQRIELARKLKAEVERSAEEALHEGIARVSRGDLEGARESFQKVLESVPHHTTAKEYLEKIESAELQATPEAGDAEAADAAAPAESTGALQVPPIDEPEPVAPPPMARAMAAGAPRVDRRRSTYLALGAAVLALVVVAGLLLYRNWDRTFPNATEPAAETGEQIDPIERARRLHEEGNTSLAVAQLRRIAPDDPLYAEARSLIARWEIPLVEGESAEELAAVQVAERESLIEAARTAHLEESYLEAERLLDRAAALAPLEGEIAELSQRNATVLEPLRQEIEIFRQGEWEIALRSLWRIRENQPPNSVLDQLMQDCYYNLGVRDLQRGDTQSAAGQFREAMALAPGDSELERLAAFSATYLDRPQDLLYRIFVKYLPFR